MFVGFCGDEPKNNDVQAALNSQDFVQSVVNAIESLPEEGFNVQQTVALFKLVSVIRTTPVFAERIQESAVVLQLIRTFRNPPTIVRNVQWAAVKAVLTDSNLFVVVDQIPQLLKIVEPSGPKFEPFQVTGLALLQAVVVRDAARARIGSAGLSKTIVAILEKFPKHTIAQKAVGDFVLAVAEFPDVAGSFLDVILPIALKAFDADNIEQRGFGWWLLRNLKGKAEIKEEIWEKIAEIDEIVERRYGGDPPKPVEGSPGNLNAQVLQMLMQLLKGAKG